MGNVDDSLAALAQDLNEAVYRLDRDVKKGVLKKGALNVKNDARKRARSAHRHPTKVGAVGFINFSERPGGVFEIGYDKTGKGNFGTFNEYGSAGNVPDQALRSALDKEAPNVAKFLVEAAAAIVLGESPKTGGGIAGGITSGINAAPGAIGGLLGRL